MVDLNLLVLFLPFALLLVLTPGADTVNVVTFSLTKGGPSGLRAVSGVALSSLLHIAAAALGISAIVATSALAFNVVRMFGAAYLIFLGVKAIAAKSEPLDWDGKPGLKGPFWQGFTTHLANPKTAIFYVTVLPQFINPSLGHPGLQAMVLCALREGMTCLWLSLLSVAAVRARPWLTASARFWAWQRRVTGAIFIGLGLKLALAKQKS